MNTKRAWGALIGLCLSLALLLVGERVIGFGASRWLVSGLGVVAALASLVTAARLGAAKKLLFPWMLLAGMGIVLYFIQTDDVWVFFGALASTRSAAREVLLSGALACMLIGLLASFVGQFALSDAGEFIELGRVGDAIWSGVGVAFVILFAVATQYTANQLNVSKDYSFFRPSKPGEVSRKLVGALAEPLKIILFFPPANDVESQVSAYFKELADGSPMVTIERRDQALEPALAKDNGVSTNGSVVLKIGNRRENLYVGEKLNAARFALRELDRNIQKRLTSLSQPRTAVYFTVGHNERGQTTAKEDGAKAPISMLRDALQDQNYEVKELSPTTGLSTEVPADAGLVVMVGPEVPLSEGELHALRSYLERGGRLMVAVDPEFAQAQSGLLALAGLKMMKGQLADERAHVMKSYSVADRANIVTRGISSHPSMSTLVRKSSYLIFLGTGAFEESGHSPQTVVDFAVRSEGTSYLDLNANFQSDLKEETRRAWPVAALSSQKVNGKEWRVLALADADALADEVLSVAQAEGNRILALDGVRWLLGQEALVGQTNVETEQSIQRTKSSEGWLFYGANLTVPALILLAGAWVQRRRRLPARGAGRDQAAPAAVASTGGAR